MRWMVRLYDKALHWSRHRYAVRYLAAVSFIEASIFPIPPYFMLAPMALASPNMAISYALIATVASVFGGVFGYSLGHLILNPIVLPLIEYFGYHDLYQHVLTVFDQYGFVALLLLGVTPIPYKIVAISSGALSMYLPIFVLTSFLSRGLKFLLVALLIKSGGVNMAQHIRAIISKSGIILLSVLSIGIVIYKVV